MEVLRRVGNLGGCVQLEKWKLPVTEQILKVAIGLNDRVNQANWILWEEKGETVEIVSRFEGVFLIFRVGWCQIITQAFFFCGITSGT